MTTVNGSPEGAEPATIHPRTRAMRLGVVIPLAIVSVLLLAVYAFDLLYFASALTGPGPHPCDPAIDGWGVCWRPEQRTFWIVTAAASVPAAICLVMSLIRLDLTRRWWPWPVATALLLLAGGLALDQVP
ncbi:hypothetical protein [Micromonospora sp. 4G55]|uniref:hypothetical protein n=1 Tax=Micromonospora sp. 4G55 TaxID=2806102 RepID=UPI001A567FB9|nr:hypothetical protein [Micromonospora sp. 4G55]MBM0257635.1 hypothetical protein [Micromonospora sp. 4G55]